MSSLQEHIARHERAAKNDRERLVEALEPLVRQAMGAGAAAFIEKAHAGEVDPSAPLNDAFGDFPREFLDIRGDLVKPVLAARYAETVHGIADAIRRHATPPSELATPKSDALLAWVADWIERADR